MIRLEFGYASKSAPCVSIKRVYSYENFVKVDPCQNWLPVPECKQYFSYSFEFQRVRRISLRQMRRQKRRELYVNPLTKAYEYKRILREKSLTQNQLARQLGVSRVRITQMLNLLNLPIEQQNYILERGKQKLITERTLRKLISEAKQNEK